MVSGEGDPRSGPETGTSGRGSALAQWWAAWAGAAAVVSAIPTRRQRVHQAAGWSGFEGWTVSPQ